MKYKLRASFPLILTAVLLTLSSCIGLSLDIQMNKDGSGRVTAEYRLSRMIENLGKLDGNESKPSLPVGRTDWERTIDRNPGLKLVSFSSKDETKDTVYKVVIDFKEEKALVQFLDPSLKRAAIKKQGQSASLDILLLDELPSYDDDMMDLIAVLSGNYNFSVSFSAPSNSSLMLNDVNGNPLTSLQNAKIVSSGKKVSFSAGIMDILELKNGMKIIFNW